MKRKVYTFMPGGSTTAEKLYSLFRHHCGVIAKRVSTRRRCRNCFTHGWIGGAWTINHGCDGCAEAETFFDDARRLFASEAIENGEGVAR